MQQYTAWVIHGIFWLFISYFGGSLTFDIMHNLYRKPPTSPQTTWCVQQLWMLNTLLNTESHKNLKSQEINQNWLKQAKTAQSTCQDHPNPVFAQAYQWLLQHAQQSHTCMQACAWTQTNTQVEFANLLRQLPRI